MANFGFDIEIMHVSWNGNDVRRASFKGMVEIGLGKTCKLNGKRISGV